MIGCDLQIIKNNVSSDGESDVTLITIYHQKKKKNIYIYIEKIVKFIVFVDCSILGDVFLFENITNSQLNVNSFMI